MESGSSTSSKRVPDYAHSQRALQSFWEIEQAELEKFEEVANGIEGALSPEDLARRAGAEAFVDPRKVAAVVAIMSDLRREDIEHIRNALTSGKAAGGAEQPERQPDMDPDRLLANLEKLLPKEDFPAVRLWRRALDAATSIGNALAGLTIGVDLRPVNGRNGEVAALVPVVNLELRWITQPGQADSAVHLVCTDSDLDQIEAAVGDARALLEQLREKAGTPSGLPWVSFKEEGW